MTKQEFQQRIAEGPLILDGATGSNLLKAGMPRGICSEKWIAEHPEPLIQLQKAYMKPVPTLFTPLPSWPTL